MLSPRILVSLALSSPAYVLAHELFCPAQKDFEGGASKGLVFSTDPSTGTLGWTMTGSGGVHGKQTFDLLGGWVEFEIDTTHAQLGVNNNFYTSSPEPSVFPKYCDIQTNDSPVCMEMDIMENNGNCMSQVTWHTWANKDGDCDQNGCAGLVDQQGSKGVRMVRTEFTEDGWMTVWYNGKKVEVTGPVPSIEAKQQVAEQMKNKKYGAMFHSTQWAGWVPGIPGQFGWNQGRHECWSEAAKKTNDKKSPETVDASQFSIRKLRVFGTVVQGEQANRCPAGTSYDSNSTKNRGTLLLKK